VITSLTRDALDGCVSLYVEPLNSPPWNESWTVADAARRRGDILATLRPHGVASLEADGDPVGFALGHLERSGKDDHFQLQEMCVRTDMRRQGHGTRLLEALRDQVGPVTHWYLLTARGSAASSFYERNGFRPARRMGVFVRPDQPRSRTVRS
jgi:aminoglycoside 6'-N-acetyltransferase I